MESAPEKTIAEWIQDLQDPHWAVRRAAAEALGASGAPEAVIPLLDLLAWEDWKTVRATAIEALGQLRDPRGLDAILEALQDQQLHLRRAALRACAGYGASQLAPRLLHLLRAEYLQLLPEDVGSFGDLFRRLENIQAAVVEVLVALGTEVVPWVLEALRDPHWRVQWTAIRVLGEVGDGPVIACLQPLAHRWSFRERVEVKQAARQAIAQIQERLRTQGPPEGP